MQILRKCRELYPDAEVVMITGYATLESAVEAMKHGAFSYIAKPFKLDEVRKVVREATEKVSLKRENRRLREQLETYQGKVKIITQDPAMQRLLETARQVAPVDTNVIITGESGTGKELFARYIHINSKRGNGPFFGVNCGAFTEELLTNELFGHEKGAFTGADSLKKGIIEMTSGGTLFLDEITEMPPSMQVKLLRVIQEKELLRVGGTEPVNVDVRFVAATNRDVQEAVKSGAFRQDLYFRLNVVSPRPAPLGPERRHTASRLLFSEKIFPAHEEASLGDLGRRYRPAHELRLSGKREGTGERRRTRRGPCERKYHRDGPSARGPEGAHDQDLQEKEGKIPSWKSRKRPTSSGC